MVGDFNVGSQRDHALCVGVKAWALSLLIFSTSAWAEIAPTSTAVEDAVRTLKGLSQMREALAAQIKPGSMITEETFKKTCAPVGKILQAWAKERGYKVRQVSAKNRNPQNGATPEEEKILARFSADAKLEQIVDEVQAPSRGEQVYVPIRVAASCLNCHGPKEQRPQFVTGKYPADKAYDFAAGDLRGMYSVFISLAKSAPGSADN